MFGGPAAGGASLFGSGKLATAPAAGRTSSFGSGQPFGAKPGAAGGVGLLGNTATKPATGAGGGLFGSGTGPPASGGLFGKPATPSDAEGSGTTATAKTNLFYV